MISLESLLETGRQRISYPPTPDLTPAVMKQVQSPAASPPVTPLAAGAGGRRACWSCWPV